MTMQMQSEHVDQIERVVAAACRLAAADEIRAVHVLTEHRPTYPELIRYRTLAGSHGLAMTVIGSGGVVLRSSHREPSLVVGQDVGKMHAAIAALERRTNGERQPSPARQGEPIDQRRAARAGTRRLRRHRPAWVAELRAMSEGTR